MTETQITTAAAAAHRMMRSGIEFDEALAIAALDQHDHPTSDDLMEIQDEITSLHNALWRRYRRLGLRIYRASA